MPNFWKLVNKVIRQADILLEVLDARMIDETRNAEVEKKVAELGKTLIFVANKCDLVDKEKLEVQLAPLQPSIYVSSTKHFGFKKLRERIFIEAKRRKIDNPRVGVLGYPNVGKSSVINALKGATAAKTSAESGFTKGLQAIRISGNLMMIDTPGVFPDMEKDKEKHAMIGSVDYGKVKEPDVAVMRIMREYPGVVERYFSVPAREDLGETLEEIALKKKLILKAGQPDITRAANMILRLWQKGEIKP